MPMDNKILQELAEALEKERDILVSELKGIARENPKIKGNWETVYPKFEPDESGSHLSREEEEDEVEEYEGRLAAEQSLESRLLQVTKSLEQVKKGTYGKCRKCGKDIPAERLKANPAAEFDMEHTR